MAQAIVRFTGIHRFLSNFYPSLVEMDSEIWPTVEHAYQACKTNDPVVRGKILMTTKPGAAKHLGNRIQLRPDWEDIKLDVMRVLVGRKFEDHELARRLIATWEALLVEGNYWGDTFWGMCNGVGTNHLGVILMGIREQLRRKELNPHC